MDMISGNPAVQKYEKLLNKIAASFGFDYYESTDLVKQVSVYVSSNYADHGTRFALRIFLSRIMVHKCIFRISNKLFSQNANKSHRVLGYCSDYKNSPGTSYQDIPLSFRAVYILNENIGFNEAEIAEILNIPSFKVKDRFNKAKSLLNNR